MLQSKAANGAEGVSWTWFDDMIGYHSKLEEK